MRCKAAFASFDGLRMRKIETGPSQVPRRKNLILSLSKDARRSPTVDAALGVLRGGRYISSMEYVFPILVLIAMLGALGALALGVINMARGNNPQRSNKLMQSRVLLQGLALLLFVIFMLLYRR
jgi:hypoxia induced protein